MTDEMQNLLAKNRSFWVNCTDSRLSSIAFQNLHKRMLTSIVKALVKPDMTICDIGCGNGENTILIENERLNKRERERERSQISALAKQ